ncbi:unnamed protein product [Vitrella brassicaformis CCMP3155]|uniref:Alpha-carbonic anhydrase domain-containing protein n=2 Tax=Vitrella brassicaformis TaxID=1169539 RepID=A0A0G4F7L7_VITBC|nr:unnamed protein product [Vitrella brassicaformis CCMP3155]|mmetsp:Transcript_21220/g.51813  ORF Transcript_21220/g.51813 Transcript_21220/m.51813 type:complete len:628 (+) Transcript_21220:195-2078(+)|eukprot:CEM07996.1 unnamed protein product [Vitrella brassicaformis CCMP3155]
MKSPCSVRRLALLLLASLCHFPPAALALADSGADLNLQAASSCSVQQGPINIQPPFVPEDGQLVLDYAPTTLFAVQNDGSGLRLTAPSFGGLIYKGEQFAALFVDIHSPSQHTLGESAQRFPLEVVIAHRGTSGRTLGVSLLFKAGETDSHLMRMVLDHTPAVYGTVLPDGQAPSVALDMATYLGNSSNYFAYATPGNTQCLSNAADTVRLDQRIVLTKMKRMSHDQLNQLRRMVPSIATAGQPTQQRLPATVIYSSVAREKVPRVSNTHPLPLLAQRRNVYAPHSPSDYQRYVAGLQQQYAEYERAPQQNEAAMVPAWNQQPQEHPQQQPQQPPAARLKSTATSGVQQLRRGAGEGGDMALRMLQDLEKREGWLEVREAALDSREADLLNLQQQLAREEQTISDILADSTNHNLTHLLTPPRQSPPHPVRRGIQNRMAQPQAALVGSATSSSLREAAQDLGYRIKGDNRGGEGGGSIQDDGRDQEQSSVPDAREFVMSSSSRQRQRQRQQQEQDEDLEVPLVQQGTAVDQTAFVQPNPQPRLVPLQYSPPPTHRTYRIVTNTLGPLPGEQGTDGATDEGTDAPAAYDNQQAQATVEVDEDGSSESGMTALLQTAAEKGTHTVQLPR